MVKIPQKKANAGTNHKDLESWLGLIGENVAVAAETVTVAAICGSLQFVASSVFPVLSCTKFDSKMPALLRGGTPLLQARNVAVMSGVYKCIHSVMTRSRGKEDVQTSLAAGFGAGFMGALMYGAKGRSAIAHGVCIALFMAGVNKIMENNSHQQADDVLNVNTSGKLSHRFETLNTLCSNSFHIIVTATK
ncbi:hypothetical protein CTI12_AA589590 [Artemisia annua]|uniref:Mitochondrial inner membrane translocase subunit Tim17/Tim22/Tim23/peroxisomal protein PMP24 n=1 Tax=Artemisia annua TaxID=35608 RepID=A0A2U1KL74_ARTAN|nr:hypothetical protein CTI12_AA589590 [Artemisia annua]